MSELFHFVLPDNRLLSAKVSQCITKSTAAFIRWLSSMVMPANKWLSTMLMPANKWLSSMLMPANKWLSSMLMSANRWLSLMVMSANKWLSAMSMPANQWLSLFLLILWMSTLVGLIQPAAAQTLPTQITARSDVQGWLTTGDQQHLLAPALTLLQRPYDAQAAQIRLMAQQRFQQMDGFGYTLTGGSAMHLMQMSSAKRAALLQELFGSPEPRAITKASAGTSTLSEPAAAIGVSYLRISLGASDLDPDPFSYADVVAGSTPDATSRDLTHFSLKRDEQYLIPLLQQILLINPQLKILASPWSPPSWMKTNQSTVGGELLESYFPLYAEYFVKYIQGMAAHGIRIDAVTVQNEPLNDRNNPSLLMHAWDQALFIKAHLGPAFARAKIASKIIIYDHNPDHVEYPMAVLNDAEANKFIDGSAFHLYNGSISELSKLQAAHPDKHIYFTEQWVGAKSDFSGTLIWHLEQLIIGASRNYAKNVLEWNLAADAEFKPYTEGGCYQCKGALTVTADQVERNVAYYVIAHASKAVPPGSWRIESTQPAPLKTVAFVRPDGKVALIVLNDQPGPQRFNLAQFSAHSFQLPAHSVVTLLLPADLLQPAVNQTLHRAGTQSVPASPAFSSSLSPSPSGQKTAPHSDHTSAQPPSKNLVQGPL